jgi:hypothetical protein
MTTRPSWLESRHLGRRKEGRRALSALERLDSVTAQKLVDRGNELAEISVSLAHAWFIAAAPLQLADPNGYTRWEEFVQTVGGPGTGRRAILQAFLDLDAAAVMSAPAEDLAALIECTETVAATSERLAGTFVTHFGAVVSNAPGPERLRAAASAVGNIAASTKWRGEFLATRWIETGAAQVAGLDANAIAQWADLFATVGSAGRTAHCPEFPAGAVGLSPAQQRSVFRAGLECAKRDPTEAERLVHALVAVATALEEPTANALLEAAAAEPRSTGIADAMALVPALRHELGEEPMATFGRSARELGKELPLALPAFIRTFDRAWEQGGVAGVEAWLIRGIEIGRSNPDAAVAHFRLESRTAHKMLIEHSTGIAFDEVEPVLQRYLRMMARRQLRLTSGPGIWLHPPLAAPEDRLVRLPDRVDLCEMAEDNHTFYKLAAAHAAGRWEYGTYDFRISEHVRRGMPLPPQPEETDDEDRENEDDSPPRDIDDIVAFLDLFPNPLLAVGLFTLLDGIRIDARLKTDFPGLAKDYARIGSHYARNPPPAARERSTEEMLEALFLVSVGAYRADELPPRLAVCGAHAETLVAELSKPEAEVYDSTRVMTALYWTLAFAEARGSADGDFEGTVDFGGATVVDPAEYFDSDGPAPPTASGEGDAPTISIETDEDLAPQEITLELDESEQTWSTGGVPLTPDEIRELIERGADLNITEAHGDQQGSLGMYITDLLGKLPSETAAKLRDLAAKGDDAGVRAWLARERGTKFHLYDEWDYRIGDYRRQWCRLSEEEIPGDGGEYFHRVLAHSGELVQTIKREFQMMRPEQFRKVRGMEDGEEFDLNALVDAHADRRNRETPTERIYVARKREERDVATLFLLDMSASTDEPLSGTYVVTDDEPVRRVIDVTKDTLVIMATVLDEIGDAYAVYGFSGHGRKNVEFYPAKSFSETLGPAVRNRLGGIEPKRSTRMGTALRHAAGKLARVSARARHLILLSDGFPQDFDYGEDRTSNVYGIRDTTMAIQELESQGIKTFCITIDPAGHDYLQQMCAASKYAVIEDIEELPHEMPRIYRSVTRG